MSRKIDSFCYGYDSCGKYYECEGGSFLVRTDNEMMPGNGAFCKHCAKNTAKPHAKILMNRKPAYILKCEHCGAEYPMYKSMYTARYVGMHNPVYGFIAPTCTDTTGQYRVQPTRKMMEFRAERKKEIDKNVAEIFHVSVDDLHNMREKWHKNNAVIGRKMDEDGARRREEMKAAERNSESETRKALIKEGIIVFDKKRKCLVNTQTGEKIDY